ncbi:helix-turn-helix domain-containing protein [Thiocapsa rosea]|uniref:Helix-turn-helix protein n=1 Tax=Thiocapsa rosea TaxID=69360 RepID=A0A495V4P0_9GAMM|nr:helix-turn-helix domain-containing protein [Thiocapsa rosea]RKT43640.1 helix-turn-helix protein [Thiocapsa rosea]
MSRLLSPTTRQALKLLGGLIEEGRIRKGWSRESLAERVGVGALTIRRVTQGEPGVAIGTYFEAASLLDIPLFEQASLRELDREVARQSEKLTLLPSRIRRQREDRLDDDF